MAAPAQGRGAQGGWATKALLSFALSRLYPLMFALPFPCFPPQKITSKPQETATYVAEITRSLAETPYRDTHAEMNSAYTKCVDLDRCRSVVSLAQHRPAGSHPTCTAAALLSSTPTYIR